MSNVAHISTSLYLQLETDLTEEEFNNKFHKDTIIMPEVTLIMPDGSVHKARIAAFEGEFKVEEFEVDEETEKPLSNKPSDHNVTAPTTMLS